MKFHRLKIRNINSLYDEQTINFDGELSQTPLFLIMGPTGSGKTTILDSICLVLFGNVPRQKHLNSGSETAEHIMSRGTGEASVTLEFSRRGDDGERVRYRAGWYCNRAYKRASGSMQTPRRSLDRWSDEADEWESLATSTTQKEYDPYFEEALADMTLEDFLRSVLLAQGAFTAFLEATAEKKADILEKLTSTEQYMSIGGRAMQRWQEARSSVQEIENQMDGFTLLSDDEFAELEAQREELAAKAEAKTIERDKLKGRLDWLKKLDDLHKRVDKADTELAECEETREEHADDFERLALAKRAQPAAKLLDDRDRLDKELSELREAIADRTEALEELEPKHAKAVAEVKAARKVHGEASTRRTDMAESINEARALYTRLESAQEAAEEKKEAAKEAQQELEELEEELEEEREALDEAVEARDEAAQQLEALSAHTGISEEYAGLEADVQSVRRTFEQVDEQGTSVEELEAQKAGAEEDLEDVEDKLSGEAEALKPLEAAVEKTREALEVELDGAENANERRRTLREELAEASTREQALQKLSEQVGELAEARSERDVRREKVDEVEAALGDAREHAESLSESVEQANEHLQSRSEVLDAREDAAKYVKAREELEDGKECPVCGSTEHPWVDVDDDSDAVLRKVEEAREALREAEATRDERQEALDKATRSCTRLEQNLENAVERSEEAGDTVEELELAVRDGMETCGVEASLDELEDVERLVAESEQRANGRVKELEDAQDSLDEAAEAHERATKALEDAKTRGDDLREKERSLEQSLNSLEKQIDSERAKLARQRTSLVDEAQALKERFDGVGIQVELEPDQYGGWVEAFESALEDAAQYREAREKRSEALEELKARVENRQSNVETIEEKRLPERRKRHKDAKKAAVKASKEVETLEKKATSLLDGEAPSDVEERLNKAVEEAEAAAEEAEARRDELQERLTTLETELEGREERRDDLREAREKVDGALEDKLDELEIADVEALREARLDDEAMAELEKTVSKIRQALAGAKATLESAKEDLQEHRDARPDALDEDADPDDLSDKVVAVEAEKTELDQQLGEKRGDIKTQKELREKHEALADELKERRKELRQWTRIHTLIGQNMGANFKKFAQALNLQRIVHKANEHLEQIHDRYLLAVVKDKEGHPKLEFEVVDTHVANTARAISTLSGGETFLVSLALALALADFRQIKMPVETLLLDEGFGTLDQQSLDDAVSTLKTLQTREKRQVGVISHVERLQEEIQHRVVVRKLSGGRSEIEVETP